MGFLCTTRLHTRIGTGISPFYKDITTMSMVSNKTLKLNACAKLSTRSTLTLDASKRLGLLVTTSTK
eukprot:4035295-Ditylum_brightwellii.AAC.1